MITRHLFGTAALAALAAAFTLAAPMAQAQESAPVDTSEAVTNAQWADNVTITYDAETNSFRFESDGIPSHGYAERYLIPNDVGSMPFSDNTPDEFTIVESADYFTVTPVDATITTRPVYSEETIETSLGRIGVAISGAQIFNDYEDPTRSIVALEDNLVHDHAAFIDACNGHTLANGSGYHYHGIPVCITDALEETGEHARMLGVIADGFPVYSDKGEGGEVVLTTDLDECGGHEGATPEFPEGIYHYHLTADAAPYMVDCYHGEIDAAQAQGGPGAPGGPGGPDFAAAAEQLGVSEEALRGALGDAMPPDFDAAAQSLGIEVEALIDAMPAPPQ